MEIVFPVSMLVIGLVVGTVSLWFITRTKLKYEFERGRVEGETERATLIERLAGKDTQLHELRTALDREIDQSAELRLEHRHTLASLSALESRLDPSVFVRTHRSWIVNLTRVRELIAVSHGDYQVIMEKGATAPLSRSYKHRLDLFSLFATAS